MWTSKGSGGVEADDNSAIVFRYYDIRNAGDHCWFYRREGGRGKKGKDGERMKEGRKKRKSVKKEGEREAGREKKFKGGEDGERKKKGEDTKGRNKKVSHTNVLSFSPSLSIMVTVDIVRPG